MVLSQLAQIFRELPGDEQLLYYPLQTTHKVHFRFHQFHYDFQLSKLEFQSTSYLLRLEEV